MKQRGGFRLHLGVFLMVIAWMANTPGIAAAADNTDAVWSGTGIDTEEWTSLPGSDDQLIHLPPTSKSDGYVYEARFACADGDIVIFPACAEIMPPCSTGAGRDDERPGTAIYWYRAAAGENPLAWHYFSGPECVYGEEPRDVLAEIAAMIAQEFQRSPVAPAAFGSQPGAHTLRGNETNVWAEAATQSFNLTLIGQQVTITATPVAYTWDYGDGTVWGPTPHHGAPLHQDRIGEQTQTSHVYTTTGRLAIGLVTHFDGTYSVNGGPELPIAGQGNISSAPLPLTVWRAETHLYADNCFQNPQGVGC